MKILFVENRYTTYIWNLVAKNLEKEGHEILWIVQNHSFRPTSGKIYTLPYKIPTLKADEKNLFPEVKKIKNIDRGLNYFNNKSDDYVDYLYKKINEFISKENPDIGFGECTLFHENIVMHTMRNNNKPYFFPASCRFPIGRIAFFKYDTLFPFGGSEDNLTTEEAVKMVTEIESGKIKPLSLFNQLYMNPSIKDKIWDKIKITSEFFKGERYNTPSPSKKLEINKKRKLYKKKWECFSLPNIIKDGRFVILFPMHMQPEMNIDVWAYSKRDQVQFIEDILCNTDRDTVIALKPNPTSYLELDERFQKLVKENGSRVIPLSHSTKMTDILKDVDLVVALTGTISLECIFSNKPVITFIESYFNKAKNCPYVKEVSSIKGYVEMIKQSQFPQLSLDERAHFLNWLNGMSFQGCTDASLNLKDDIYNDQNINQLSNAFGKIINQYIVTRSQKAF